MVAVVVTVSAVAQAPQNFNRPTADELFNRAGLTGPRHIASAIASVMAEVNVAGQPQLVEPIAVLRSPGNIVSTSTAPINIDVKKDYGRSVWVAGEVYRNGQKIGEAAYANKKYAQTAFGPGYYTSLTGGGIIPFDDVSTGNAGDCTIVIVQLFDSENGGAPIGPPMTTTFWNRVKPVSAVAPMVVNSASILADGASMQVNGNGFPTGGQAIIVETGDPEWDSGFVATTSADGKTLRFAIPTGKTGNFLYPRMWAAQSNWTVVVTTLDGTSVTAPNLLQVQGNSRDLTVAQVP
jgi:hypothetical protein